MMMSPFTPPRCCLMLLFLLLWSCCDAAFVKDCATGIGLKTPPAVCTGNTPCTSLLKGYWLRGILSINTPESAPSQCAGTFNGRVYNDGSPRKIAINDRTEAASPTQRSFCAYVPTTTAADEKIPLVIYFHGSGGSATGMYGEGWRHYAQQGIPNVFSGKPFALVGAQALNRHWPPSGYLGNGEDGTKFDFMFRNISQNDDVHYVDMIIDNMVAAHNIDPSRIFVSGYSNGCYFANMYASVRSGSTDSGSWGPIEGRTPDGHMVAAASSFSGSSPWQRPPDCPYADPPKTSIPLQIVIYACDLIPCSLATDYAAALADHGSVKTSTVVLSDSGAVVDASTHCVWEPAGCTTVTRLLNHATYPHAQIPLMAAFMDKHRSTGRTPDGATGGTPQPSTVVRKTPVPTKTATSSFRSLSSSVSGSGTEVLRIFASSIASISTSATSSFGSTSSTITQESGSEKKNDGGGQQETQSMAVLSTSSSLSTTLGTASLSSSEELTPTTGADEQQPITLSRTVSVMSATISSSTSLEETISTDDKAPSGGDKQQQRSPQQTLSLPRTASMMSVTLSTTLQQTVSSVDGVTPTSIDLPQSRTATSTVTTSLDISTSLSVVVASFDSVSHPYTTSSSSSVSATLSNDLQEEVRNTTPMLTDTSTPIATMAPPQTVQPGPLPTTPTPSPDATTSIPSSNSSDDEAAVYNMTMKLILSGNFSTVFKTSKAKQQMATALRKDLAKLLGVGQRQIDILSAVQGSLIVDFEVSHVQNVSDTASKMDAINPKKAQKGEGGDAGSAKQAFTSAMEVLDANGGNSSTVQLSVASVVATKKAILSPPPQQEDPSSPPVAPSQLAPDKNTTYPKTSWLVIVAPIAAVMLVAMIIVAAVILVKKQRSKQKKNTPPPTEPRRPDNLDNQHELPFDQEMACKKSTTTPPSSPDVIETDEMQNLRQQPLLTVLSCSYDEEEDAQRSSPPRPRTTAPNLDNFL